MSPAAKATAVWKVPSPLPSSTLTSSPFWLAVTRSGTLSGYCGARNVSASRPLRGLRPGRYCQRRASRRWLKSLRMSVLAEATAPQATARAWIAAIPVARIFRRAIIAETVCGPAARATVDPPFISDPGRGDPPPRSSHFQPIGVAPASRIDGFSTQKGSRSPVRGRPAYAAHSPGLVGQERSLGRELWRCA